MIFIGGVVLFWALFWAFVFFVCVYAYPRYWNAVIRYRRERAEREGRS